MREISAFPEGDRDDDEPEPPARPPGGVEPVRAEAVDTAEQVAVVVGPGGTLLGLTFTERSKRLGPEHLAATVLGLVRRATAQANERTRHVLAAHAGPVGDVDLDALGLAEDPELAAHAELTTPDTWMR